MPTCPKCGTASNHAVWPYLKGTLEYGEELHWHRCQRCAALFTEHVIPAIGKPADAKAGVR
jgi:hypothetical protein